MALENTLKHSCKDRILLNRDRKIEYVKRELNNCLIEDKVKLLNTMAARIEVNSLQHTNEGTAVWAADIDDELLDIMYVFVCKASPKTKLNLELEPE